MRKPECVQMACPFCQHETTFRKRDILGAGRLTEASNALEKYYIDLLCNFEPHNGTIGTSRRKTLRKFIKALETHQVRIAMEIAFDKFDDVTHTNLVNEENLWRYFCGICWNKMNDQQAGKPYEV